jgi:drug/metabolite transporter (DMT)-like permease
VSEPNSNSITTERIGFGIGCAATGLFGMSLMDACAKFLGSGFAISQVVLTRNAVGAAAILIFVAVSGSGMARLRPSMPGLLMLRSIMNLCAAFLFFTALRYLPLADAFAVAFAAPLFITALSVPILGEQVGIRRWSAVTIGFFGVLFIVQPGPSTFRIETLLPLGAALSYAVSMLIGRKMTRYMTVSAIMFWPSLVAVAATSVFMPIQWQTPEIAEMGLFLFMGIVGTLGMSLIALGYRNAPAAVIAPFDYTVLIWGVIFGWIIWKDVPALNVWIGSAILIASGLYILYRETRTPRPVQPVPRPLGPTP